MSNDRQREIIEQARSVDIIRLLRRLDVPVQPGQVLIRCFRPENHKHNDEHPSMHIDRARNRVRCFVCDRAPLDPIDVVRIMRGCGFREAVEFITHRNIGQYVPTSKEDDRSALDRWRAQAFKILNCSDDQEVQSLGSEEGRGGDMVRLVKKSNAIYAELPAPSFAITKYYVENRGVDFDTLLASGIRYVKEPERLALETEMFEPALAEEHFAAIPHRAFARTDGPVLYFHLRALNSTAKPKELFARRCPMFATFNAPGTYRPGEPVLICEGHVDALTAAARGLNAISLPGGITSWRDFYARELKGRGLVPILAFDSEPEADRKAFEILGELVSEHIIGYRAALPPGEDINSWLLKCERAMSRLARLDVPLLDPSATEVGWLRLDFDLRKGKYCWKGEWQSRYKDQHPE